MDDVPDVVEGLVTADFETEPVGDGGGFDEGSFALFGEFRFRFGFSLMIGVGVG